MKIIADLSVAACRRSPSGWMPSRLFQAGTGGTVYDPAAPETLWANTDGTLPATVGGAVARMDDTSGNGHHLTQAIAAARPTLREDAGGRPYLDFDGVDDRLVVPTFGFAATDGFLFAYGGVTSGSNGRILNRGGSNSDMWTTSSGRWVGSFSNDALDGAGYGFDLTAPHAGEYALRAGQADMARNGVAGPTAATTGKAGALDDMVLGARSDGAGALAMHLYGFVAVEGGADAATRARLRHYLAAKSGVTL